MQLFKNTNFDFLGKKWPFIIASLVLTAAGFASILMQGGLKYGIFKWLYHAEMIDENPMLRVEAPKRQASEDLDVVSVTGGDVRRLFDVCETWGELLCISTLAYLGPRRGAVAKLRWRDVDLERGRIRFKEKGGKAEGQNEKKGEQKFVPLF